MSTTPPKSLLLALTKAKKASVLFIMAAEGDYADVGSSPRLDELCDEAGRKEADAFEALENWLHEK